MNTKTILTTNDLIDFIGMDYEDLGIDLLDIGTRNNTLYLSRIIIKNECRGQGRLRSFLIDYLVPFCEENGIDTIRLQNMIVPGDFDVWDHYGFTKDGLDTSGHYPLSQSVDYFIER